MRKTCGAWTLAEVEKYYGKEAADWIRASVRDGTIKPTPHQGRGYFTCRLKNPKFKRMLTFTDKFRVQWDGPYPSVILGDANRYGDTVTVVLEAEVWETRRWIL